jgi:hypothetical protein
VDSDGNQSLYVVACGRSPQGGQSSQSSRSYFWARGDTFWRTKGIPHGVVFQIWHIFSSFFLLIFPIIFSHISLISSLFSFLFLIFSLISTQISSDIIEESTAKFTLEHNTRNTQGSSGSEVTDNSAYSVTQCLIPATATKIQNPQNPIDCSRNTFFRPNDPKEQLTESLLHAWINSYGQY